jgi:hypothetical protein
LSDSGWFIPVHGVSPKNAKPWYCYNAIRILTKIRDHSDCGPTEDSSYGDVTLGLKEMGSGKMMVEVTYKNVAIAGTTRGFIGCTARCT